MAAKKKRGPGRPKGSKNKKRSNKSILAMLNTPIAGKRKRGRPKGSKSKQYQPTRAQFMPHLSKRRGRGRPKGSKNKNKSGQVNMLLSKLGTKKAHVTLHGTITAG